jgi:hypothetical protein
LCGRFQKSNSAIDEHIKNSLEESALDVGSSVRKFRAVHAEGYRLVERDFKHYNDDRFKSGSSMNYFNQQQDCIREIRLSEKFFYQEMKDLYATGIDNDPGDEKTIEFFKVVQNKILWASKRKSFGNLRTTFG